MKLSSLLAEAAVDLNDAAPGHEFTTWHREQIRAYIEEAIQIAFSERPDLFSGMKIIKVQPCSVVQETCDCTHITRVIGQVSEHGMLLKPLRERKNNQIFWPGHSCPVSPKAFMLNEFMIDQTSDKLWLWPQVPAGLDVYVMVICAVFPSELDDDVDDIPDELAPAIRQWVLFRAKMVDGENSEAVVQVANTHKTTFYELLALSKQDEATARNTNARRA